MSNLFKWILFTILLFLAHTGLAWTIGNKSHVNGPSIHTTYFLTPNNVSVPVHAYAYLGNFINGNCIYTANYNIGSDTLKTGDTVVIDAFQLKSIAGNNYTCATIFYIDKQVAAETFLLEFNGFNYINSYPAMTKVNVS